MWSNDHSPRMRSEVCWTSDYYDAGDEMKFFWFGITVLLCISVSKTLSVQNFLATHTRKIHNPLMISCCFEFFFTIDWRWNVVSKLNVPTPIDRDFLVLVIRQSLLSAPTFCLHRDQGCAQLSSATRNMGGRCRCILASWCGLHGFLLDCFWPDWGGGGACETGGVPLQVVFQGISVFFGGEAWCCYEWRRPCLPLLLPRVVGVLPPIYNSYM